MKKHIPLSIVGLLLSCQLAAYASVTSGEIQAAIDKANILKSGTSITVSVAKNQVTVGTYRSTKASDKDCKIDSVLMAKTIMDLAPDVTSVSVYFYNRADLSAFEQVTLSAGDIKAFASGDVGKEQFMSSVKLEHHEAEDSSRIANYIQAAQQRMARRPAEAKKDGGNVTVAVDMEPWVPTRDLEFEALRIAQNILQANPGQSVQNITITFNDPTNQIAERVVAIKTDELNKIEQNVNNALESITIARSPARRSIGVSEGPLLDDRKDLAKRIVSLKIAGSDADSLEKDFSAMDAVAKSESEAKMKVRIKKMDDDISAQEKILRAPTAVAKDSSGKRVNASEKEIVAAIEKSHIILPSSTMTVRIQPGTVIVATYKATTASEKDSKIDAILIAKTVMDLAPEDISNVTMYFYGRNDLSAYDEITLSAGDIKAFAGGKLTKDQLLSSVKLEHRKTEDIARIANNLEAREGTANRLPARVSSANGIVSVVVPLESWVQDRDARYEAFRIVEKVLEANRGKTVQSVKITFSDPDMQIGDRDIVLTPVAMASVSPVVGTALGALNVTGAGAAVSTTGIAEGPLKERRAELYKRIMDLKAQNVGVGAFLSYFKLMEEKAASNDPKLQDFVTRMDDILTQQEKSMKALKDRQKAGTAPTVSSGPAAPAVGGVIESRWAMGHKPISVDRVMSDPNNYIVELAAELPARETDPGQRARYFKGLRFFAQQLRMGGKLSEAADFDRRVYDMRRRFPELNKM